MKQEQKLIVGLVVLIALVGGVYLTGQEADKKAQAHSITATQDLPVVKVSKEDAEKVTKLVITNKDKGEVTLAKKGDKWELSKPLAAPANQANIKSLIDNLQKIEVKSLIAQGTESYDKYELVDKKAVHLAVYKGEEKALDMYFGKQGGRGQMARVSGKDGVYVVKGYSSHLFGRELKNWRDTDILKFEDGNAIAVTVENEKGKFSFTKTDDKWSGAFYKRSATGKVAAKAGKWAAYDAAKVKDMLRAYKNLKATDFAKEGADTGLDDAAKTGGTVHIKLKDDAGDYTLKVGKTQEGSNRFLLNEGGDGTVYVVSSWAADWAVDAPKKFEKPEEKKEKDDGAKK